METGMKPSLRSFLSCPWVSARIGLAVNWTGMILSFPRETYERVQSEDAGGRGVVPASQPTKVSAHGHPSSRWPRNCHLTPPTPPACPRAARLTREALHSGRPCSSSERDGLTNRWARADRL